MKSGIPERGDIVWLQFDDPPVGHEQGGHRPALVISHFSYNQKTGLCMCLPITTKVEKEWPWFVALDDTRAVIADQCRCIDFNDRDAKFKETAPAEVVERAVKLFKLIITPL